MSKTSRAVAALLAAAASVVAACGGSDSDKTSSSSGAKASSNKPVTINWWHIANNDPLKTIWKNAADQYMAAHPNVKVKITVLENEAFKAKLTTNMQAGKPPDIFQSWGGGTLKEQADAGLVKDITEPTKSWIGTLNDAGVGLYKIGDKQYGIPYNLGLVGVWYNKKLFKKAGIDGPPTNWNEFLGDIPKLKSAGITPIAVGEKDKWPGMFWWANLSLRVAGKDAMAKAATDGGTFTQPGFVEAGNQLKKLIALKPFQQGYLASPWDGAGGEAATVGNGRAAMDLMGQWAPSTFAANTKDKKGLGKNAAGSRSRPSTAAPDSRASSSAAATVRHRLATPRPRRWTSRSSSSALVATRGRQRRDPAVAKGTESSVTDPNMKACSTRAARRRSSSSTSTRRTRPRSARRSTTRSRSCSRASVGRAGLKKSSDAAKAG